jgi:hypothetical protein
LEYGSSNQGVGGSNPFGRTFYQKEFFGSPGHEIGNEQIEPLTDNKTVRLPGAAPGWTSPRKARRRSGAKRRTRGPQASKQSVRAHYNQSVRSITWHFANSKSCRKSITEKIARWLGQFQFRLCGWLRTRRLE